MIRFPRLAAFLEGLALGAILMAVYSAETTSGHEVCVAICDGPAEVDQYHLCACNDGGP